MGGLLVGVPAFLTMEIWWGSFTIPATRLLVLAIVNFGVLLILQHYSGTTHRKTLPGEARAALVTLGIGVVASIIALFALGVLHGELHARELVGKLLLQTVPVSIGASVAMSEFGENHEEVEERRKNAGYWDSLGMALGGAMLFGFAISGTEEPLLIAEQLSWTRALLLMFLSMLQVYAIVYAVDFRDAVHPDAPARLTIEVTSPSIVGSQYEIPVKVHNRGDKSAKDVVVHLELVAASSDSVIAESVLTIDWLPRESSRDLVGSFTRPPTMSPPRVRGDIRGYIVP